MRKLISVGATAPRLVFAVLLSICMLAVTNASMALPSVRDIIIGDDDGGPCIDSLVNDTNFPATGYTLSLYSSGAGDIIANINVTTNPAGTVTYEALQNPPPDGPIEGYNITVTGIVVQPGEKLCITIRTGLDSSFLCPTDVELHLNGFTFPGLGDPWPPTLFSYLREAAPFEEHLQNFTVSNKSGVGGLTAELNDLVFSVAIAPGSTPEQRVEFFTAPGATLAPGESLDIALTVPASDPGNPYNAIYATGTMTHSGDGGSTPVRWATDYEVCRAPVVDTDSDGVNDVSDNCTLVANPSQVDSNGDGYGNYCDADLNDDCIVNAIDLGLFRAVFFTADPDADLNVDGVVNAVDLGIFRSQFFQSPGPSAGGGCPVR